MYLSISTVCVDSLEHQDLLHSVVCILVGLTQSDGMVYSIAYTKTQPDSMGGCRHSNPMQLHQTRPQWAPPRSHPGRPERPNVPHKVGTEALPGVTIWMGCLALKWRGLCPVAGMIACLGGGWSSMPGTCSRFSGDPITTPEKPCS